MANLLTVFRILITFPIIIAILQEQFRVALVLTLLGAFSDLIDGKIARQNGEDSSLGKLLDPLADKIFVLSILIALVETDRVSSLPVILLLLRELGISFFRSVAVSHGIVLGASFLGKLKAFLEFLSLILIIGGYPFGNYLLWLSVGAAYISAYDYIKTYLRTLSGLNYP